MATSLVMLGSCSQQASTGPATCVVQEIESGSSQPEDWGSGIVGYRSGYGVPEQQGSGYSFVECLSETTLYVPFDHEDQWPHSTPADSFDQSAAAQQLIARLKANKPAQIKEIERLARSEKLRVMTYPSEQKQSCGCSMFYPELRGHREPYVTGRASQM